jgi:hypothetical protein
MSSDDRPEQVANDNAAAEAKSTCVALVPVVQATEWSQTHQRQARPNSIFVTQLIATAEQAPQTSGLHRATAFDALTAYRATQHWTGGAGMRARQTV